MDSRKLPFPFLQFPLSGKEAFRAGTLYDLSGKNSIRGIEVFRTANRLRMKRAQKTGGKVISEYKSAEECNSTRQKYRRVQKRIRKNSAWNFSYPRNILIFR